MANEIKVLRTEGRRVTFMYYIPIASPVADDDENNFIITPTSDMDPAFVAHLTAGEITALDNGEAVGEIAVINADEGLTPAEILALAQSRYATREAYWLTDDGSGQGHYAYLTMFHQHVGKTFNK